MLGLIIFLYLSTVGNILSQDIVVLQVVKTESVLVLLNNTRLSERNSNASNTAEPDTVYRIKKPEKTPALTVDTDQKKALNFIENKIMNMFNKVGNKDDQNIVNEPQNNSNNTITTMDNKTSVPGSQKPTDSGGMNATNVSFEFRTGINGDMCTDGYVKVDGNCVKEIK